MKQCDQLTLDDELWRINLDVKKLFHDKVESPKTKKIINEIRNNLNRLELHLELNNKDSTMERTIDESKATINLE